MYTGKPPPGSRNQLFNVNWFLAPLFHWWTGSLDNSLTASPSSTNKAAANCWKLPLGNEQKRHRDVLNFSSAWIRSLLALYQPNAGAASTQ